MPWTFFQWLVIVERETFWGWLNSYPERAMNTQTMLDNVFASDYRLILIFQLNKGPRWLFSYHEETRKKKIEDKKELKELLFIIRTRTWFRFKLASKRRLFGRTKTFARRIGFCVYFVVWFNPLEHRMKRKESESYLWVIWRLKLFFFIDLKMLKIGKQ